MTDVPICSFCGKNLSEVRALIAGPCVYICDECIILCVAFIQAGTPDNCRDGCRAAFADILEVVKPDIEWMARCGKLDGVEI